MSDETEENVQVLYDFDYPEGAGHVQIKAGDVYKLIERTNSEWWQVSDPSDVDREPFFVPADYVKVIYQELKAASNSATFNEACAESLKSSSSGIDEGEYSSVSELRGISLVSNENNGEDGNGLYVNVIPYQSDSKDDGEYVNLDQFREAAGIKKLSTEDISGASSRDPSPRTSPKPPPGTLELIQGTIPPPSPEEGKFVKVLVKGMPWDIYKENTLGRLFYVNRETGERMWKPPRKSNTSPDQPSVPTTAPAVQVKKEWSGIPTEYEQVHENGSIYFIHRATQEKWKSLVDKLGRQYFHKLGSSDTQWTLPTTPELPDKENLSESADSSVQQKGVDWENQGNRLSTFGGHQSLRASKAMSTYGQLETPPSSRASTLPANLGFRRLPLASERSHSPVRLLPQRPTNLTPSNSTPSLQSPQAHEDVYEGYLNKTKILDVSKKKVKKSWSQVYVVLQGSNLVFYKDQKSATQRQNSQHVKPEAVVSLQNARVDLNPKELTSKKNTISLRVTAGNVYLFQSDSEKENFEWFTRMKLVANDMSPAEPSPRDFDVFEVKKEKGKPGFTRSISNDEIGLHNVDKNKNMVGIRAKLYNLISRRPTQEDLYKRGIIKDAVFGSHLQDLCEKEKVDVPKFVHRCVVAVESRGLTHDGIYRISGNMAEIQRLRCTVDKDDTYDLFDEQWDIYVLTGTLKLFFRELKEPVFPFHMYDTFSDAIKKETRKEKLAAFKSAVIDLPRCNFATLKELFLHLCKVMDTSSQNRMQAQNIAIVFGPTLLWQQGSTGCLAVQTVYQSKIVEFILLEYKELFH